MTDIVERLRKPLLCEETLEKVLDPIAKLYRAGDTGSLPRDIFESFTDDLDCERAEAAALIASQAARIRELEEGLAFYADKKSWVTPDVGGFRYHQTGDGIMDQLGSRCGVVEHRKGFVHPQFYPDCGRRARSLLPRKGGE